MAIAVTLGRIKARMGTAGPIIGRPWSANDVAMVLGWVAILPLAAARFEHDILVPPVNHLSAGGNFIVASAASLTELTVAALLARVVGTALRHALRRMLCLWHARYTGHSDRHLLRLLFRRTTSVTSASTVKKFSWQV
jgi:hypothetical protein